MLNIWLNITPFLGAMEVEHKNASIQRIIIIIVNLNVV